MCICTGLMYGREEEWKLEFGVEEEHKGGKCNMVDFRNECFRASLVINLGKLE